MYVADWRGLWSYVHKDDEAEGGRISRLARDLGDQFEMLTGEKIRIFLDKDALGWGDDWREQINDGLASVAFFIPVLTPRYFMSSECRRELQYFARSAARLGVTELVMPLLYVDVPALDESTPADDLVSLVRSFQWEDWRDLRFADVGSEPYRRCVSSMAARLVEANNKAITAAEAVVQGVVHLPEDSEAPGLVDRLADTETAVPEWTHSVESIAHDVELVGQLMESATQDFRRADAQGKGYAGRLVIARQLASEIEGPAERILAAGNDFASQLHRVDDGIRIIIANAADELAADPKLRERVCEFFTMLRTLAASIHGGLEKSEGFIHVIQETEGLSRDLRSPLRKMRQGLTTMLEAREVADEWVALMDATRIDCQE